MHRQLKDPPLTASRLRELLSYDVDTGILVWIAKSSPKMTNRVGQQAGTPSGKGYVQCKIDGYQCFAHRIAWCITHGEWPVGFLDHENGSRSDNRLSNLRPATKAQNNQNRHHLRSDNTSGVNGVGYARREHKWRARITIDYKEQSLGYFDTIEEAQAAYREAKVRLHTFGVGQCQG